MCYCNHVFVTPSSRKEIILSLCAFLIKKGKGKTLEQIEQVFPAPGSTRRAAVPLHAAWKGLRRGKEQQLPQESAQSSGLHQQRRGAGEEATGPPAAADGAPCRRCLAPCLREVMLRCRLWKRLETRGACSYRGDGRDASSSRLSCGDSVFWDGRPPPPHPLTVLENVRSADPAGLQPLLEIPGTKYLLKVLTEPSCCPAALLEPLPSPSAGSSSFRQGRSS